MEITKVEVEAVEVVIRESKDVCAFADLHLALIGGGIGEVFFG
jgi:hypothetical protein